MNVPYSIHNMLHWNADSPQHQVLGATYQFEDFWLLKTAHVNLAHRPEAETMLDMGSHFDLSFKPSILSQ